MTLIVLLKMCPLEFTPKMATTVLHPLEIGKTYRVYSLGYPRPGKYRMHSALKLDEYTLFSTQQVVTSYLAKQHFPKST